MDSSSESLYATSPLAESSFDSYAGLDMKDEGGTVETAPVIAIPVVDELRLWSLMVTLLSFVSLWLKGPTSCFLEPGQAIIIDRSRLI